MNNNIKLIYYDVDPSAKTILNPNAPSLYDNLNDLKKRFGMPPNIGNPCEDYSVILDGKQKPYPNDAKQTLGFISEEISNSMGVFDDEIVLTLVGDGELFSSKGITLTFDVDKNIYATSLEIVWKRSGVEISRMTYSPDNPIYFCENKINGYDELKIIFKQINMPRNRLRLVSIDYGKQTELDGASAKSIKCIQEIDIASMSIPANTTDLILAMNTQDQISFAKDQPILIYYYGKLVSSTFVDKVTQMGKSKWSIRSSDYIRVLDDVSFNGDIYTNKNVRDLMIEIFDTASMPYNIDDVFSNEYITGYIPYCTCREALTQVIFATGALVDTSNSKAVNVFKPSSNGKKTIGKDRIFLGQKINDEKQVSRIDLTEHYFAKTNEQKKVLELDQKLNDVFVKFDEPLWDLTITNGNIIEYSANFARITSFGDKEKPCVLSAKKYMDSKNIKSRFVSSAGDIIKIENATLVSSSNLDKVLKICYDYYAKQKSVSQRIVEQKHIRGGQLPRYGEGIYGDMIYGKISKRYIEFDEQINVGDLLETETEYLGNILGRVQKQTFNLNGGSITKDLILR